ncbi:uncharacterized protein OGAPODRAFT_98471 [Ogataea polymorpha]|uniref:uncharacterized protein n=1 Tax=Ogataea polymorpha TaxID=460523 RepID=UPI0007F42A98|nr:uncharacterized protein OGAPODRAFT_98471 [Ogataea polymorpha]OBA17712.1 hypothetical protein OGAPODRAFT_98471 [Ogataea polymorpha]
MDSKQAKVILVLKRFVKFIGPGLMVSVSYMDPGNFSSSISSAQFQYKLLFSLIVSNMMAGFMQILASKLGICTGQDLAANCRQHLPKYVNFVIYIFAELAVAATDMAEIIGTAIAFNILFGLPLLGGVMLTTLDVLFVLLAYRPNGPLVVVQIFEAAVGCLVLGTVVCFIVELVNVSPTTNWGSVFRGFLPSKEVFTNTKGLYLTAALLGSNLMPHSLYLGSGVVQARMKAFDIKHSQDLRYIPSMEAINGTMSYIISEMVISLITVALFVNSSILIVAGTALSQPMDDDGDGDLENADLFTLHYLLSSQLSKAAGTVFALALLCSGLCGGTVVTIASQQIMEGHVRISMHPALKRIITRIIAITPCIAVVTTQGREGLSKVLNATQVVLSLLLPFISAPLVYLTCKKSIMRVLISGTEPTQEAEENIAMDYDSSQLDDTTDLPKYKDMSNNIVTAVAGVIVWLVISLMNFWLLISMAMGKDVD